MGDNKSEKKDLEKIAKLLEKINMEFTFFDLKYAQDEVHPAIHTSYKAEGKEFDVIIRSYSQKDLGKWINMRCFVFNTSELDTETANKVFKLCLQLNYFLPETTFSWFDEKIFIESDMPIDVSLDDFKFELKGLSLGLENLTHHFKSLGLTIDPTKDTMLLDYSFLEMTWE
ncbi:MAG TPA: hypothetical protein VMV49_01675 [Candidatus Deferrimicrobium sp.]|nr:hypothetical protein [Candidatus Deferrimicrobium sp.]